MADLLGWTSLLGAALNTVIVANRARDISLALTIAFGVRAAAALFHFYIAPLPDGGSDAVTFEQYAWEWSLGGVGSALDHYPGPSSYFYSWLMSLVYALTDRSLLMLQSLNVLIGTLGVYAVWRLTRELWSRRAAQNAAWLMALFPSLVQYAALPMREVWVVLFFILGLTGVVRWARHGGLTPILSGNAAFIVATFFHGGLFVAVLGFLILIAARTSRLWLAGLSKGRLRLLSSLGLISAVFAIGFYVASGVALPKLGTPEQLVDMTRLIDRAAYFTTLEDAAARYPNRTVPSSPIDLIWAVPLRGIYLLFSPFPWDLDSPRHLVGLIDGLLYLGLIFLAWRNRRKIQADPGARAVFFLLIPLVVAFGMGTGNFGTALRHRAKFVGALIVLASPRIPRLSAGRPVRETESPRHETVA